MNANNGSGLLATLGGTTLHDIYNFRHSKIYEDQTLTTKHCYMALYSFVFKRRHCQGNSRSSFCKT